MSLSKIPKGGKISNRYINEKVVHWRGERDVGVPSAEMSAAAILLPLDIYIVCRSRANEWGGR